MNERDLWWKIVIIGALTALSAASIWPLDQKLKYGIDLRGGYSLLYEIDDTGMDAEQRRGLAEQVMRVLRERVDPKGVLNLVWRPVGHKRLEIQMPRPSDAIQGAREKFETHQQAIRNSHIRRSDILRAVSNPATRDAALAGLVRGIESRSALLQKAAQAWDEWQKAESTWGVLKNEVEAKNLAEDVVKAAVEKPAVERQAAFEPLIHGKEERRALLQAAAEAWDTLQAARPTTQPADPTSQPSTEVEDAFRAKDQAYRLAIRRILDTNVDPESLPDGINAVVKKELDFDQAAADTLATNIDTAHIQVVIEAKPNDEFRKTELEKLKTGFPGLAADIDAMVEASDVLRSKRRGEGRLEDPADLQRLLRGAGVLEFRILAEWDPTDENKYDGYIKSLQARGPRPKPGEETYQWFEVEDPAYFTGFKDVARDFEANKRNLRNKAVVERFGDKYYALAEIGPNMALSHRSGAEEWSLKSSSPDRDANGRPCIRFELDEKGGQLFRSMTRANIERQLCIFLDDQAVSSATIQEAIGTRGQITGNFSLKEVQELVRKLNAGSLPRKLKEPPISVRAIGPSLGQANREAGMRASLYGALCVAVFMIFYYYYAGTVAVVAVGMNMLLTLAAMSVLGATLTLPGIAGLVLSIGMAVDANVLINERMREELNRGAAMRMAIKLGYERAFSAILDANVTTIITCIILYFLGSEEIKGFGLMLGIGVFANLFTGYFVTRIFFEFMSMHRLPMEVARYPLSTALGISAVGAGIFGLGYVMNDEISRQESVLIPFGQAIFVCGPVIGALMLVLYLLRGIHAHFQKGDRPRMPMRSWVGVPKVDWFGKRKVFIAGSIVMLAICAALFWPMKWNDILNIEFLGGTSAQIDLKPGTTLTEDEVANRLTQSGDRLKSLGDAMSKAQVTGGAGAWQIACPGVPAYRLEPAVRAIMGNELAQGNPFPPHDPADEALPLRTKSEAGLDLAAMQARVQTIADRFRNAGGTIADAQVQLVEAVGSEDKSKESFEIVTLERSKDLVVDAIMDTMRNEIDIQPGLNFEFVQNDQAGGERFFVIRNPDPLDNGLPLDKAQAAGISLEGLRGAVGLVLRKIDPPQSIGAIQSRLRSMRLQPGFEAHSWRETHCFGLTSSPENPDLYTSVLIVVADENFPLDESGQASSVWIDEMAAPEIRLVEESLRRQTSLSQINQFDEQVSGEAQNDAIIALVLSWIAIIIYVWFRFGNVRWGLAAVVALVHDVMIAAGFIIVAHYLSRSAIGKALLIEPFRIDLGIVAALLTIIGFSVNDTIVVFDRIRENKGHAPDVKPEIVNSSVSQTFSRTLLTSLTAISVVTVMYAFGGRGIRGFNYVLFIGMLSGVYSTITIAAPILVRRIYSRASA